MKKQRNKNPIVPLSLAFGLLLGGCGSTAAPPEATETLPQETANQAPVDTPSLASGKPEASEFQAMEVHDWSALDMSQKTYPDAETFIAAWGFAADAPSYTYEDAEGNVQLALYYDEAVGAGCGVRYVRQESGDVEPCGFAFEAIEPVAEKRTSDYSAARWYRWESNYASAPIWNGGDVDEYDEDRGYDEDGHLVSFESSGIFEDYGTSGPVWIRSAQYVYDEAGTLRERHLSQNTQVFGTHDSSWDSYFDAQGRVCHERGYITHGSQEYYYLYTDEDTAPDYCLYLDEDCGVWRPEFVRY